MATSVFFNNIGQGSEQRLYEDLIIESIKIHGIDVYYIPRTVNNRDEILREGEYYSYDSAQLIEAYLNTAFGAEGQGEFLAKFGVEVRDQHVFTVAQRRFSEEIGSVTSLQRPQEGDLLWIPLTQALYQIKYVNIRKIFYQLGALQTYDITTELYESSSEIFNTGIDQIDNTYTDWSLVVDDYVLLTESGDAIIGEDNSRIVGEDYVVETIDVQAQNETFQEEIQDIADFTELDPFGEGARI